MASVPDDTIHKQSFSIDDLATRSVTLYPTRAAVVRDIENVTIEPGRNEITLHNLTPQADEHSIKVEGHGTNALITDMTVDLIPNYRFSNSPDSDSEDESDEEPSKSPELEQLTKDLKILRLQMDDADESRTSAMKQLHYLDQLTDSLSHSLSNTNVAASVRSVEEMSENLNRYSVHRERIYQAFKEAQATCAKLHEELEEKTKKHAKAQAAWEKSCNRADRAKEQRLRQKTHERRERQEQKLEVPRSVYRIRITIESESLPENTQAITSSVATGKPATKEDDEPPLGSKGPSLRISYITGGASWTPRYDLRLDTISGTGTLTYRAHFFNRTGEIWRNAKLTLSTSQTSFSGLEDKVPWMDSWRITLRRRGTYGAEKDGGLYSAKEKELKEERLRKRKEEIDQAKAQALVEIPQNFESRVRMHIAGQYDALPPAPPAMLKFGQASLLTLSEGRKQQQQQQQQQQPLLNRSAPPSALPPAGGMGESLSSSFSQASRGVSTMTSLTKGKKRMSFGGGIRSSLKEAAPRGYLSRGDGDPYDSDPSDDEDDSATLNPPQKMGLAASSSESYGLTTTYDLPGLRTIPPSKLLRRHVITEINLPHVEFSHISAPKLRAAAFLKARIRNPSNTPLLRGPAGLTLDGSFLGNSTIPRCAPDDHFELGLGVDEEVLIEYRKPIRKVASQGMLVKEQVVTYERCARIHNARGNLVKLVVFDQVPVSEDERLRVSVSKPRGLKTVGDFVKVPGSGASFLGSGPTTAGTVKHSGGAVTAGKDYVQAEMRKGGEIRWEVSIEGGKDAVLPLEYEARLPSGEVIFGLGDASTLNV